MRNTIEQQAVDVNGKMRELMALLEDKEVHGCLSGVNTFIEIAMKEHFKPALEDIGQGSWTSENIEAWIEIFENDVVLTRNVLLGGLYALFDPLSENISQDVRGDVFHFMKIILQAIEQVSDLGDDLTLTWGHELNKFAKAQEGGAR